MAWTYEKHFATPSTGGTNLLVFEGVKTGAQIWLNERYVGETSDQFLRYVWDVTSLLSSDTEMASNTLSVRFNTSIDDEGRYMACTGGWDWAPISNTYRMSRSMGRVATFSLGIPQEVALESIPPGGVSLRYLVPATRFLGEYPTVPMRDGEHAGFEVNATVHLWAARGGATGSLEVSGNWSAPAARSPPLVLPAGRSRVSVRLQAPAGEIALWWPNGMGAQPLFNLTARWVPAGEAPGAGAASTSRLIGFRVPALVTVNDSDPAVVRANRSSDGSGTHGMYFRVNGAPLFARGANAVPMEEMEGRASDAAHRQMVASAADAGMNMLRVWGGGAFFPEAFYSECDARGLLLYHDLMFVGSNHSAVGVSNETLRAEVRHQVRRLAHHPSIILYDGANEIIVNRTGPTTVFSDVVLPAVAEEDPSRVLWPSSPAAGWLSGVNALYGTPDGEAPLVALVGKHAHIWSAGRERHGPYTAGVSTFESVCNDPWSQAPNFDPNMPLAYLQPSPTGIGQPSVFTSEFGVAVMASFESMAPTLDPQHYSLHGGSAPPDSCEDKVGERKCEGGNPMAQRNWVCDNIIWSVFGSRRLNSTGGAEQFQAQLYQCLVAQALVLKQRIEALRASNSMGVLVWQLNDIWPTGSWGSLEYGTASNLTGGQVVGGRWKPVHHLYAQSVMQDVFASCGALHNGSAACFLRSDLPGQSFQGRVQFTAVSLASGEETAWMDLQGVQLPPGPGAMAWFPAPGGALPDGNTTVMLARVTDAGGAELSTNTVLLAPPSSMRLPADAKVTATFGDGPSPASAGIPVTVASSAVAVFVTLTSQAQGRFSDNCFL